MKKRMVSLCLSLLLVLSMVPTAAFAVDNPALEIGKEYEHTLTTSQPTQTFTFTPTEDGLYRFKLLSKNNARCYFLSIIKDDEYLYNFGNTEKDLKIRYTISYLSGNQTYTIQHHALEFIGAPAEGGKYTLTVEKLTPPALVEGTATKYVPDKIGNTNDYADLEPYDVFAPIPISFTPKESGWYTFSTKEPVTVIYGTPTWFYAGDDNDETYNDSLFVAHEADSIGDSVYLHGNSLYYIVMTPYTKSEGTISVKKSVFPAVSVGNPASFLCGHSGSFATFSPDISGKYTITPSIELSDPFCGMFLYSERGKLLKYTGDTEDPQEKITYDFQKGSTYYICLYDTGSLEMDDPYPGTLTITSDKPLPITDATVTIADGPHAYTGSPITPEVTVKLGQTTLVKDTDYTVAYTNNTNVGKATVTITGKGNYTGTKTAEFDITKAELAVTAGSYLKNTDGVLTLDLDKVPGMPSGETFVYEAAEGQTPTGFTPALTEKTLTLTANGSGTVGGKETYRVNAASANYSVTITVEVAYTDKDVKEIKAPAVTPSVTYNGKPAQVYTGTASVDGVPDVEFTVTYVGVGETEYDASATAPTNAGRYTVTFALKNEEDFVANPVVQPFAITKATPAFTAPTSTKLTAAAPLRTVALTGGEVKGVDQAVIPGTFSWSGDTSVNVEKGTEYPWGFTPTTPDANYDFSAVTGKLTPWASSGGGSGGSGGSGGGGGTAKPPVKDPEPPTTPETPPTTSSNFADVPSDAYYADAVAWAVSKGITTGTGDGKFSPAAPCTRAQVVTFLWRAAGSPAPSSTASFADVPADAYYRDAVLWAVEKGITNGTGADAFSPDATVDRAQTVTFLYRYAGSPAASGGDFQDVASGSYYADAVAWAVSQEITNGTSPTTFAPASNCTRGQTVTFLFRALAQ